MFFASCRVFPPPGRKLPQIQKRFYGALALLKPAAGPNRGRLKHFFTDVTVGLFVVFLIIKLVIFLSFPKLRRFDKLRGYFEALLLQNFNHLFSGFLLLFISIKNR